MIGEILYETLGVFIECAKMLVLYRGVLCGNVVREKRRYLCVVCGIVAAVSAPILSEGGMGTIFSFAVVMVPCMFLARDRLKGRFMGFAVCYIIINIIDAMPSVLMIISDRSFLMDSKCFRLFTDMGMFLIYSLISIILYKVHSEHGYVFGNIKRKYVILFMWEILSSAFAAGSLKMYLLCDINRQQQLLAGISVISVCTIMLFVSIFQIMADNSREEYKKLLINQGRYFRLNYNYCKEMYKFRHDLGNHLGCIYNFCSSGNVEKTINYIKQLQNNIGGMAQVIDCGNETVSAVINGIYEKLVKGFIDFKCEGHLGENSINDVDLCTIFSNVLENAYEACLKVESGRILHIRFGMRGKHIYACVKNSTTTEVERNQKLVSDKGGVHGIGMINVCEVVERYGGLISWYAKEGLFVTEIII